MWRFIALLIILFFSVWLGLLIAKDPGLAYFSDRQWSVTMPLWFAIVSFIIILWIFYFIFRLFSSADLIFYRLKNWVFWRRKDKSYTKTTHGIFQLIEGHYKNAEVLLSEGIPQSNAPILNYLALAKAADASMAYARRDDYLQKAHAVSKKEDVPIGIVRAYLQLHSGQIEQALATLTTLRTIAPKHPAVLKLLERIYIHAGDWENLCKISPDLYKAGVVTRSEYPLLQKRIYVELLKHSKQPIELWKTVPKKFAYEPKIIFYYAQSAAPSEDLAEIVIKSLKKSWFGELVEWYGNLVLTDVKKQLARAETLLKYYPKEPILLCTLGKIATRAKLWGKARSYFIDSLKLNPAPKTYAAYARLLEELGDQAAALENYREGLSVVTIG